MSIYLGVILTSGHGTYCYKLLRVFYNAPNVTQATRCKLTLHIIVQGVGLHCTLSLEHVQTDMHRICGSKHGKEKYLYAVYMSSCFVFRRQLLKARVSPEISKRHVHELASCHCVNMCAFMRVHAWQ